jgi:hypothetical protein
MVLATRAIDIGKTTACESVVRCGYAKGQPSRNLFELIARTGRLSSKPVIWSSYNKTREGGALDWTLHSCGSLIASKVVIVQGFPIFFRISFWHFVGSH